MKLALFTCVVFALAIPTLANEEQGDRTITKVIKMLQGMLVKSKADGEKDIKLFAKYKCYCDSNAAEKTKEIADGGEAIELLAGEIAALQGENGSGMAGHALELQLKQQLIPGPVRGGARPHRGA